MSPHIQHLLEQNKGSALLSRRRSPGFPLLPKPQQLQCCLHLLLKPRPSSSSSSSTPHRQTKNEFRILLTKMQRVSAASDPVIRRASELQSNDGRTKPVGSRLLVDNEQGREGTGQGSSGLFKNPIKTASWGF